MKDKLLKIIRTLFQTGFFHIYGSTVLNKVVAFLGGILLVRILSKEEYGVFTYALNIYHILLIFNGMGMDSAFLQTASERSGDVKYASRLSHYGAKIGLSFNAFLSGAVIAAAFFAPLKIKEAGKLLFLLCLLPLLQFLFQMMLAYLRSQKRNQDYAKLTSLSTVLYAVLSVAGAYFLRAVGLVLANYAVCLLSLCFGVAVLHVPLFQRSGALERQDKKAMLPIAFISMCNNGLSSLLYLLDVFVLGIIIPQEAVLASYKTATLIPMNLNFIPSALVLYIYPYFAEHRKDGNWCLRRYKQIMLGFGGFNFCLSTVLFALAPTVVKLLFGAKYLDAVPVFRILSINYFFAATFRIVAGNLLATQRKLLFNFLVSTFSGLVNIIADYFFIQWWGAIGAALATVLVVLITSVSCVGYLVCTFKNANANGHRQR